MTAKQYIKSIRNEIKRAYAENYLCYLQGHRHEPDISAYALTPMAAQAVRRNLHKLQNNH